MEGLSDSQVCDRVITVRCRYRLYSDVLFVPYPEGRSKMGAVAQMGAVA